MDEQPFLPSPRVRRSAARSAGLRIRERPPGDCERGRLSDTHLHERLGRGVSPTPRFDFKSFRRKEVT